MGTMRHGCGLERQIDSSSTVGHVCIVGLLTLALPPVAQSAAVAPRTVSR
jgi:hypothetical protein